MFREIERDYSSLAFLLPNRRIFGDDVLLQTPTSSYTAYNLDKLMIRLGRPNVIPMWIDTRSIMDPFVSPDTDIVCVGGIGAMLFPRRFPLLTVSVLRIPQLQIMIRISVSH